jgi:site-specific recombinase XerD
MLAALKGILRECRRLGHMSAEACAIACDLKAVRGERLPRGRGLTSGELRGLFEACAADETAAGRRDEAILATLYGAGLRRCELSALDRSDWDAETGALTVRAGKGTKARLTYLSGGAAQAIAAWCAVRGDDAGPLFWPADRLGSVSAGRLSDQGVLRVTHKRGREAAVSAFSPHDLRRSMISDLLDAGADISTAQRLAGHANVNTTQRYDRRGEQAKQRAAGLLSVPFVSAV